MSFFSSLNLRRISFIAIAAIASTFCCNVALAQSAPAVATGDTRTVTEPTFPALCSTQVPLTATFHDINRPGDTLNTDVPASVETQFGTAFDTARIQAAMNACSSTTGGTVAVELSMDANGNNAFLTGPLTLPSGVTLLIDSGVTLYFSRNAQDYDSTPGTHTCGTVSTGSNQTDCKNLILVKNVSNAGIMGYGKMDGRGEDAVLNFFVTSGFPIPQTAPTWWDIANDIGSTGAQQNPRFVQISNGTNITFYKFTIKNAPNFHFAGGGNGVTWWGIKIITPFTSHNTDGIDPTGTNVTITHMSGSDGDDNVAVGSGATNVSVTHNRFFAGHGESIGSITSAGLSNILFDSNMNYGDADVDGSNSTAVRIKSADDRGGNVNHVQYSNSCFANHGTQMQFNTLYNTNTGTSTPNFNNILLQNLRFVSGVPFGTAVPSPVATGSATFQGAINGATNNPLTLTLDNVTVDTAPTLGSPNTQSDIFNAQINLAGPVSTVLSTPIIAANSSNSNVITGTGSGTLTPPTCIFTFLTPEITGPTAQTQTITTGENATAVVILSPAEALASMPYPTGTVTITDENSNTVATATLPGTGDTIFVTIPNPPQGTHTYHAAYGGNTLYPAILAANWGSTYSVTVNAGTLAATGIGITGVPANTAFGTPFTAVATLTGTGTPTGSINFLLNGVVSATAALSGKSASSTFNLPFGTYSFSAVYNGDASNAAVASTPTTVAVTAAPTTTVLGSSSTTTTVGTPVTLTATVSSAAGTVTGTVQFSYVVPPSITPVVLGNGTLNSGVATFSAFLPLGADNVIATYNASGSFATSTSSGTTLTVTVGAAPPVPDATLPVAIPYTITTIAGGGPSTPAKNGACPSGGGTATDAVGDGCQGTSVGLVIGSGIDLRVVSADPFGNIYFTDGNNEVIHKIAPNGVMSAFIGQGLIAPNCTPAIGTNCIPTAIKLTSKPRGVYADPLGNVYVAATTTSNQILEYEVADGLVHLIAGTGGAGSANGAALTTATFNGPRAIATDGAGNVYIADTGNELIRELVVATGNVTTVAGCLSSCAAVGAESVSSANIPATTATLTTAQGLAIDTSNNVYIATSSGADAICVTCAPGPSPLFSLLTALGYTNIQNGNIYTVAGGGTSHTAGLATTLSISAQRVALDANGNLYISDGDTAVAAFPDGLIWFEDGRTGFAHPIAGNTAGTSPAASTACTGGTSTDAIGDGCVGTQGTMGSHEVGVSAANGFGLGSDYQGNIYISDTLNARIRKLSNNLNFGSGPVGTPISKNIQIHYLPNDTPVSLTPGTSEFVMGTPVCTLNVADATTDCVYPATFTPAIAGVRTTSLAITTTLGNPGTLSLSGVGTGAGATLDPGNQFVFGQGISPNAIATDNSGNVYVADSISKKVLKYTKSAIANGASAVGTVLQTFTNPAAVAVDSLGDVFVADATTGFITEITAAGVTKTLPTIFTTPDGLAVDSLNNLYVSDAGAKTVTKIGLNVLAVKIIGSSATTPLGLKAPAGLTVDANGNVFVADTGAIIKLDGTAISATPTGNVNLAAITSVTTAAATPTAVAVDAADNLIIADAGSNQILAVPAAAPTAVVTVATTIPGTGLALDSIGNVYTNSGFNQVLELQRTVATASSTGFGAPAQAFSLISTGNAAASLALTDPDTTDFKLALATPLPTSCTGPAPLGATLGVALGGICNLTSSFTPAVDQNFSNTITFAGAANGPLTITQTGTDAPFTTTTVINAATPASPLLGQAVTLKATVTSSSGLPAGTVTFAVDGTPITPASTVTTATGVATATAPPAGLTVGPHTITASFTSSSAFTASSVNFAGSVATSTQLTVSRGSETAVVALATNPYVYNTANTATFTLPVLSGTPTGTAQFSIDGAIFGSPVTIASSAATITLPSLTAGQHTISAAYSGDSNFSPVSASPLTFTVSKASTAVALTLTSPTPAPTGTGVSMTFTAVVSNSSAGSSGSPTGSVEFLDTGVVLSTVPLTGNTATFTTSFSTPTTHNIAAVYIGDANFAGGFSATLTEALVTPGFTTRVNPNTLTIARGNSGTATFTFTPVGNYQGTLSLACSGLPAFVGCTFTPSTITFAGDNTVQSSQLVVTTNGMTAPTGAGFLWLAAGLLACFVAFRRRKLSGMLRPLLMLVIAAFAFAAISGCGNNGGTLTPTGTTTVNVSIVAIGTGGSGSSAQNVPFTIVITQ